ncbi:hypothetical protein KUCAC02_027589, partial [Chaenocephalus aceratus]
GMETCEQLGNLIECFEVDYPPFFTISLGCCCRLYSVTTVCTQPGAPSNATSLAHTPHG